MSNQPLHQNVVQRAAPAKINLCLSVGPRRESDGLHPIASWMARLELSDQLTLAQRDEGDLSLYAIIWHDEALRKTPIDWSITSDLAVSAHRRLEEEVGRSLPVRLKLEKRIPVGGGLAGGSADAAATLLATRELFELDIPDERLAEIALELGSDVPYMLHEAPAVVSGVGDQVQLAPRVIGDLVLIFPEFGCPTGGVYQAYDDQPKDLRHDQVCEHAESAHLDDARVFNDLAVHAERIVPELAEVRAAAIELTERPVHITGSGSTLFILCPDGRSQALVLASKLGRELPNCETFATRFV